VKASLLLPERQNFASLADTKVADSIDLDARNALRLPVSLRVPHTAVQTFSTEW
jgi:hypothetical protein